MLWAAGPSLAQKLKVAANPQAPQLNMLPQLAALKGTTLEIELTGARLNEPTGLWTDIPGAKVTIPPDNNNGKDQGKLRVKVEIPKEAEAGYHACRLATQAGISNLRMFFVDELTPVVSNFKNRSVQTAQPVSVPCAVSGRIDAEASDYYKLAAKAGERLSFEVLGQRLGGAIDPQLTLFDAAGRELPGAHSNDAPGLQNDPRLTYTFKDAGDYLVQVRDAQYRGGADYGYLLRIGDFPCATTPLPAAAKRGSKPTINFAGPQVDGVAAVQVQVPADPQTSAVWVLPRGKNGLIGSPVELLVSDVDEVLETEPNNEPAQATRIPAPGAVTGRFLEKGDRDHFVFTAKQGQVFAIEAQTQERHSPAEVYFIVKDAKGKELARTNPAMAARLNFTAPENGDYQIVVEHLLYWFGPNEVYRLALAPVAPDFEIELGIDRYDIPQGEGAIVQVLVERKNYNGPVEIAAAGNPAITGSVVIPAGQAQSLLYLSAKPDLPPGAYHVTIVGKATIDGKPVVRRGESRFTIGQSLGGMVYPPLNLLDQVGVAVAEKPPVSLAVRFEPAESARGQDVQLIVTAKRAAGFDEPITLAPLNLPPTAKYAPMPINKGQSEIKGPLNIPPTTPFGSYPISFTATTKDKTKSFTSTAAPGTLLVSPPFELAIEPAELKLSPGDKVKLKVTVQRKLNYQGPIELVLQKLPAGVTAAPASIAAGQNSAEVELAAAANATLGEKKDVGILGNAAAIKQQHPSPDFTVNVVKK